jgi:hypothetical protein
MAQGSIYTDMGAIDVSVPASGDLSSDQFKAITLDGSGEAVLAGANAKVLGILQNIPAAQGEVARVRVQGISKAIVSETVAFGKFLTPTSAGILEVVDAADEEYCARAMGANVVNDEAEVLLAFGEATATDA